MEVFSRGNEHYRILCMSPAESFDRYEQQFAAIMRSVQFIAPQTDSTR
jgi:hypothetical protein